MGRDIQIVAKDLKDTLLGTPWYKLGKIWPTTDALGRFMSQLDELADMPEPNLAGRRSWKPWQGVRSIKNIKYCHGENCGICRYFNYEEFPNEPDKQGNIKCTDVWRRYNYKAAEMSAEMREHIEKYHNG